MPVKLSGELVADARESAKRLHRSLTGQIEHWAAIGRAVEAKLPDDALASIMEVDQHALKITDVTSSQQRAHVFGILAQYLEQTSSQADSVLLAKLRAQGVPLYGTTGDGSTVVRRNPGGEETPVGSETNVSAARA